jgi:hypothetical protein
MSQKNVKISKKLDSKQKINWTKCSKCELAFLATSNDEVHECFSSNIDSPFVSNDLCLLIQVDHTPGNFIHTIPAFLFILTNIQYFFKELYKDLQIGKDYLFDFAFLNGLTIKTANIQLDDMIVVQSKENQTNLAFTCWPSSQLDCSHIALSSYYLSINGMKQESNVSFYWKKIDKSLIKTAKSVTIEFQPHLSSVRDLNLDNEDENLKQDLNLILFYLKEKHLNKVVLFNQNIFVTFMGQKVVFKITNIRVQPNKNQNKNKHDSKMDLITNQMNLSLTMNETRSGVCENQFKGMIPNDLEFYKIDSKTKIDYIKNGPEPEIEARSQKQIGFNDIGGLEKEIELLKEFFVSPFENNELYKRIGKFGFAIRARQKFEKKTICV